MAGRQVNASAVLLQQTDQFFSPGIMNVFAELQLRPIEETLFPGRLILLSAVIPRGLHTERH